MEELIMTKRISSFIAITLLMFVAGLTNANAESAEELLIQHYKMSDAKVLEYFQAVELITNMNSQNSGPVRVVRMHIVDGTIDLQLRNGDTKQYANTTDILATLPTSHRNVFLLRLRQSFPETRFAFLSSGPAIGFID